jgi:DamX protein
LAESDDYFSTPEAASRLDLIRHLIENSELVPLVRGPSGIGKTVLASRVQALAPENWMVCHFSADSMMQPERLLAHIARCSGLPDASGDNLARLIERFELLRTRGYVPVLLVDDVQALPPTSLITLLRLYERQVSGAPLVSLVLFANEEIDMLLSTPQLQIMSPQAIQAIDLPPLTRAEANSFMRFLLHAEGLSERLSLDESKMNRIYRETLGIPGPLASAILDAVGEERESPSSPGRRLSRRMVYGGTSAAVVLALLLIFQGPINRLFQPGERKTVSDEPVADSPMTGSTERLAKPEKGMPPVGMLANREEKPVELVKRSLQAISTPTDEVVPETPVILKASSDVAAHVQQTAKHLAPGNAGEAVPEQTAAENAPGEKVGETSAVSSIESKSESVDGAGAEGALLSQPAKTKSAATLTRQIKDAKDIVKDAPPPESKPDTNVVAPIEPPPAKQPPQLPKPPEHLAKPAETPQKELLRSHEWLLSQAPETYTIQLLAVENIESIQSYIKHHPLAKEAFALQIRRKGKPWYPLLWRVFPDKSAALEALKSLPPEIRKGGAWTRSFASLQK